MTWVWRNLSNRLRKTNKKYYNKFYTKSNILKYRNNIKVKERPVLPPLSLAGVVYSPQTACWLPQQVLNVCSPPPLNHGPRYPAVPDWKRQRQTDRFTVKNQSDKMESHNLLTCYIAMKMSLLFTGNNVSVSSNFARTALSSSLSLCVSVGFFKERCLSKSVSFLAFFISCCSWEIWRRGEEKRSRYALVFFGKQSSFTLFVAMIIL